MSVNLLPTFQTERLTLRPLRLADAGALLAMYSDEETMRFVPSLPHQNLAETEKHVAHELGMAGSANWAICWGDSDEAIGHIHYLGQTRVPGMGYIIKRAYWGQGVVVEAARVLLDYGFDVLGHDRVELWIDETNAASQRVAQKLGFGLRGRLAQRYKHRAYHHIMLVYGLWGYEWRGEVGDVTRPGFFTVDPVLFVHDVAESVAFYCEKLGFGVDFLYGEPPNYAGVSRGDWSGSRVSLHLAQVPEGREVVPSSSLYVRVGGDLDRLYEGYLASGVTIEREPTSYPWGMREFTVLDNMGYKVHFGTEVG